MLLDQDPHSQYGSGSKTAKGMRIQAWIRIRIRNTGIYYRRLSPWVFYAIMFYVHAGNSNSRPPD
jgi:hypothetical protein